MIGVGLPTSPHPAADWGKKVTNYIAGPYRTNRKWRRMVARGVVRVDNMGRVLILSKRNHRRHDFIRKTA